MKSELKIGDPLRVEIENILRDLRREGMNATKERLWSKLIKS